MGIRVRDSNSGLIVENRVAGPQNPNYRCSERRATEEAWDEASPTLGSNFGLRLSPCKLGHAAPRVQKRVSGFGFEDP